MKNSWQKVKLGEVTDIFDSKRIPLSGLERKNCQGEYPYYGASGIIDHIDKYIFDGNYILVAEDGENLRSRNTPVAFSASGKFWVNNHAHIIKAKPHLADDKFILNFILNYDISGFITGSAQPKLTQDNLKRIPFLLPLLPIQQKIASILSAFDDKIEVNNKIAKNLEEMAQALFKEWFVNFRFPGYEKVEFVDSELGKIPKGWEIKSIKDVSRINKGISYSSEEIKDNSVGLPMINLANFQRGGGFNPDGIKFFTGRYKTTDLVKPGDIVIAMTDLTSNRKVIGHPARVPSYAHWDKILISLDVCSVETDGLYVEFLYYLMLRKNFSYKMASSAGGTNVAHLSKSTIEDYTFVLPEESLIEKFQNFVGSIFNRINIIELENQKLAALHDLLLPKLMKGELRA